ncbi:hypothetical protein FACS1894137_05080 [Spirochaetia bacterium]|nr:hypothetical protein FACS1894137_05080 [Spirochaetia bacterium]
MSFNFFDPVNQEPATTDTEFGLCDDQNGTKAYSDRNCREKWIATVKNENRIPLIFTAIDNGVISGAEAEGRERCEGMLSSKDHLYFMELKHQKADWIQKAKAQLESTINIFIENHGKPQYKHKKAFACNKKHSKFRIIDNDENLRFFRTYGFRLDIQAEIIVVG